MKKAIITILAAFAFTAAMSQTTSIYDLQFVSDTDLKSCDDLSAYDGQVVTVVGVVVHDGNLTELASSSLGYRPGVHLVDTTDNGKQGPFKGIQIHGVHDNTTQITALDNLLAGDIVQIKGTMGSFSGESQIYPLSNADVTIIGFTNAPKPITVSVGDLNDNNRTNNLETGEQYEGAFVTIEDVTVTNVNFFTASGKNRVSFDVTDKDGNTINVGDRFLAQKLSSYETDNSGSPVSKGSFEAPVVGTFYESISGIITHSENGCSGSSGRGYELNPFDTSHYKVGDTPPAITEIERNPLVPTSTDAPELTCKIVDFNGTVSWARLYYSTSLTASTTEFDSVDLSLQSGSTELYEATLPMAANGEVVRYYLGASDNDGNVSYSPFNARSLTPNTHFYTVRDNGLTIEDIQKVLNVSNDESPYNGMEVTVTGTVVASAKNYDLGYIYIQDPNSSEWGGIECVGNSDLLNLYRTQEVKITGQVNESFGFTQLDVSKVELTGNTNQVDPVEIDITDTKSLFEDRNAEKYEGMLVKYVNPNGKVYISIPRINNFGEYAVAVDQDADFDGSARVQAGIQNNNNSSSLWVSVVSDDTLSFENGEMEVTEIEAEKGMSMDALVGVMYYGFSQYKIKPRNNDDFENFSEDLEETDYPQIPNSISGVEPFNGTYLYPNPGRNQIRVGSETSENFSVKISTVSGVNTISLNVSGQNTVDVSSLAAGMYFVTLTNEEGQEVTYRWVKN
jgi:hypothetical protein